MVRKKYYFLITTNYNYFNQIIMSITESLVSGQHILEESLDSFIASPRQQLFENLDDSLQTPHCKNMLLLLLGI